MPVNFILLKSHGMFFNRQGSSLERWRDPGGSQEAEYPGVGKNALRNATPLVVGGHGPGHANLQDGQTPCHAGAAMECIWESTHLCRPHLLGSCVQLSSSQHGVVQRTQATCTVQMRCAWPQQCRKKSNSWLHIKVMRCHVEVWISL